MKKLNSIIQDLQDDLNIKDQKINKLNEIII